MHASAVMIRVVGEQAAVKETDMTIAAPPSAHGTTRSLLRGLLGIPPHIVVEHTAVSRHDVVRRAAMADVYEFTSADYPGAALSEVFDTDGTTALGGFIFAPGNASSLAIAFTVAGGVYQILNVPNSAASIATGINTSGLIVGAYQNVAGSIHGYSTSDGSTFNDVDFPGGNNTQIIDVNDAGDVVGTYSDAANVEHGFVRSGGTFKVIDFPGGTDTAVAGINTNGDIVGGYTDATGSHGFLLSGGVFTPINFPLASSTTAWGINDDGDIAGVYTDTAGKSHGFVYADKNFSTVDVAGASGTQLTRIKNSGQVTGFYIDALSENHGLISR
jgi:probable HAF family extracellular repeat protein